MASSVPTSQVALLIIDNQRGFAHPTHWGRARSNPSYEANVARLLAASRIAGLQIIHIKHLSRQPGSVLHPSAPAPPNHPLGGLGVDFEPNTMPLQDELVIEKHVNSAFIGTHLEHVIRSHRFRTLYICGLTTDHCVSTTTRMAGNLHVCDHPDPTSTDSLAILPGRIVLVDDATACWEKPDGKWDAETVHAVHIESLREFADVESTELACKHLESYKT